MIKLGFPTNTIDGWPPFDHEHIWVEQTPSGFRVKNAPLYIHGIAYDDEILVHLVNQRDNYIDHWEMIFPSGNSTVWIMELRYGTFSSIIDRLESQNIFVSEGYPAGYFSVTILADVELSTFDDLVFSLLQTGSISVAYGSLRHLS